MEDKKKKAGKHSPEQPKAEAQAKESTDLEQKETRYPSVASDQEKIEEKPADQKETKEVAESKQSSDEADRKERAFNTMELKIFDQWATDSPVDASQQEDKKAETPEKQEIQTKKVGEQTKESPSVAGGMKVEKNEEEKEIGNAQEAKSVDKEEKALSKEPALGVTEVAAVSNLEDTGILSAIKREIKNTPKPKKILVSTIVATMAVVSLFGFGAYAFDPVKSKADSLSGAAAKKTKPAKLQLFQGDKKYELDLLSIGYDGKNPATIDQMKLTKWLDHVRDQVKVVPRNARFKNNRWGNPIIPEEPGKMMDVKTIKTWFKDLRPYINKPTEIPMVPLKPKVTSQDLKNVNKKMIGNYTTWFDPGNTNRTTNIKLASKAINNLVLLPGERFSFNRVVGVRTMARGYKPAHVIVKGEFTEGIGGGICQVSSTLYNSVDEAGLKVTAIQHHSANVTYVPKGRDATVSWGGPDFKFKNNLNKPILIRVQIAGPHITVYIYTTPGAKVQHRSVPKAPESSTTVTVADPNKPNATLPKTEKDQETDQ